MLEEMTWGRIGLRPFGVMRSVFKGSWSHSESLAEDKGCCIIWETHLALPLSQRTLLSPELRLTVNCLLKSDCDFQSVLSLWVT